MNIIIGYKRKIVSKELSELSSLCIRQLDQAMVSYLPFRMAELSSSKLIVFGLVPTAPAYHPCALSAHSALRRWLLLQTRPGSRSSPSLPEYSCHPGTPLQVWAQCPPLELVSDTSPSHCRNSLPSLLWFVPGFLLPWMYFHLISYLVLFSGSIISPLLKAFYLFYLFYFGAMSNIYSPPFLSIYVTTRFLLFFSHTGIQINVMK